MTDTIPVLHKEAQAIIDDMAEYGLEKQDGRTSISWNSKVEEWKIRVAFLRDRITPFVKDGSPSIKAARAWAQSLYAHLLDYQISPFGSINDNIADWAELIRINIRDKLT